MYKNLNVEALGVSGRQSELIELVLTYKFRGLDLDLDGLTKQVGTAGAEHALRFLQSARATSKLNIGGFHVTLDLDGSDAEFQLSLKHFDAVARVGADVGATLGYLNVATASDELTFKENFERHCRRLGEAAAVAEPHGLRLGVGFLAASDLRRPDANQFVVTADNLLTLIGMVGSSNVGLHLDLWDWYVGGGTVEQLQKFGWEKIVSVRVADAPAEKSRDQLLNSERLLPGATGIVPIARVLQLLAEAEFEGPVTPAPSHDQFAGATRDKIVSDTSQALDKVWPRTGSEDDGAEEASESSSEVASVAG